MEIFLEAIKSVRHLNFPLEIIVLEIELDRDEHEVIQDNPSKLNPLRTEGEVT